MATVKICGLDTLFLPARIHKTSFFLTDADSGALIDSGESVYPDDVMVWYSALSEVPDNRNLNMIAYAKFHYGKEETPLYEVGRYNQRDAHSPIWACNGNEIVDINTDEGD